MSARGKAFSATLRAWWRGVCLAVVAGAVSGAQVLWRVANPAGSHGPLPRAFHAIACRVLGIRVDVIGKPLFGDCTVWVGNHLSYLDIPVLGSLGPMRFVAKQDIAGWPVFGWLAGLQRTVYISRRPRDAVAAGTRFAAALEEGGVVVLFPEGSSSDGSSVLPFRPSLLQAVLAPSGRAVGVQAFTLRLCSIDGHQPDAAALRDLYAYHRDMSLLPHLGTFLRLRGAELQVIFHPPVDASLFPERRTLALELHRQVTWGLVHGTPMP